MYFKGKFVFNRSITNNFIKKQEIFFFFKYKFSLEKPEESISQILGWEEIMPAFGYPWTCAWAPTTLGSIFSFLCLW
jgi:hypothetical protein